MYRNLVCLLLIAGGCAVAHAQPVEAQNGRLTDTAGRVLYIFDKDSDGRSVCNDACAALWPPFTAAAGASAKGALSLVRRDDGSLQWAHRGKPLYFYAPDVKPGQVTGDGAGGVWHVTGQKQAEPDSGPSYSPKGY